MNFVKYYLVGYLNTYYTSLLFSYDSSKETYRQYKLRQVLSYLGFSSKSLKLDYLAGIFSVIEVFISVIIITLRLAYVTFRWIMVPQKKIEEENLFFSLSLDAARCKKLLKVIDDKKLSSIQIPFVKGKYHNNEVKVMSGIMFSDIIWAYTRSFYIVLYMYRKYRKRDYLFRNYSSFEYLLTGRFLNNIYMNNKFVFYSLYDRWGVMLSNLHADVTLIQHGKLPRNLHLIKLGTPSVVYYISKEQESILNEILFREKPAMSLFRPPLEFTSNELLLKNGKKNVLLVCYNNNIESERMIVAQLAHKCNLYVKPHPFYKDISDYEQMAKVYECIILPKTAYPKVDMVLSYDSTLADEYINVGVDVIRYDLLENLKDLSRIV